MKVLIYRLSRFNLIRLVVFVSLIFVLNLLPSKALGADGYTVNSNLRHNPGVSASQMDGYIRSVYPSSPLVGLGEAWISAGAKNNIDPVYLMAHAILESGWGFSWIAENKFNLYGWGAYDRDPEGMAYAFSSYEASINDVASNINNMYLTPGGDYYTPLGPTLRGMNIHYATSKTWADSIAEIMNEFADGITGYRYPPPFREFDATYAKIDMPSVMQPGRSQSIIIRVGNGGDATWTANGPFKLYFSMTDTFGRPAASFFVDFPVDVKSGQSTLLAIPVTAPAAVGLYNLRFDMAKDNTMLYSSAAITPLTAGLSVIPVSLYYQAEVRQLSLPSELYAGTLIKTNVNVVNVSPSTWPDSLTSFGYQWIDLDTGYVAGANPLAGEYRERVFPGQTVAFPAEIRVPEKPGRYVFKASPVDSGVIWFLSNGSPGYSTIVDVLPDYSASYAIIGGIEPLLAATPKTIYLTVTNRSRMTWVGGGAVRLSYSFYDTGGHEGYSTPMRLPQDVRAGESFTLPVDLVPPMKGGPYSLSFDLNYADRGWFSQLGVPVFKQPVFVGYDIKAAFEEAETGTVTAGRYTSVRLMVRNTSKMVWPGDGRLKAGYRIGYVQDHTGFIPAVTLRKEVKPGEATVLEFTITDPPKDGVYYLMLDLYLEDAGWFSDFGNTAPSKLIVVAG